MPTVFGREIINQHMGTLLMNAHLFDSANDYYDQYEDARRKKEAQDEYDADNADMPTCDEDYQ